MRVNHIIRKKEEKTRKWTNCWIFSNLI